MRIYFAHKSVSFTQSEPRDGSYIVDIRGEESISLERVLTLFDSQCDLSILCGDSELSFGLFTKEFKEVTAAGGMVTNPKGELLMINRFERWDLPKGHLEQGESLEQCAMREVEEETGVSSLNLGEKLRSTLHAYEKGGVWELKTTHWWAMTTLQTTQPTPQSEEGIAAAQWVPKEIVGKLIETSFPTIKLVFSV